jgi:hypothetical protein
MSSTGHGNERADLWTAWSGHADTPGRQWHAGACHPTMLEGAVIHAQAGRSIPAVGNSWRSYVYAQDIYYQQLAACVL